MQIVSKLLNALADRCSILFQHIYNGSLYLQRLQANANRQTGLTVQINHQHLFPCIGQSNSKIMCGGRLCDTAFLVCDCNYLHGFLSFCYLIYISYFSYLPYINYIIYSCYFK